MWKNGSSNRFCTSRESISEWWVIIFDIAKIMKKWSIMKWQPIDADKSAAYNDWIIQQIDKGLRIIEWMLGSLDGICKIFPLIPHTKCMYIYIVSNCTNECYKQENILKLYVRKLFQMHPALELMEIAIHISYLCCRYTCSHITINLKLNVRKINLINSNI